MIRRKSLIIVAGMALFIFIGAIGIMIMMPYVSNRSEERTIELSATISCVDTSPGLESISVKLTTETPQLTLYIPPYVTEYMGMSVIDDLVPQSIIRFRVDREAINLSADDPVLIYSLSTDEHAVYTLSEHNACLSMSVKPMYMTGGVVAGLSACALAFCMFSVLRIRKAGSRG